MLALALTFIDPPNLLIQSSLEPLSPIWRQRVAVVVFQFTPGPVAEDLGVDHSLTIGEPVARKAANGPYPGGLPHSGCGDATSLGLRRESHLPKSNSF